MADGPEKRDRIPGLDALRGLAIVGVIFIHASALFVSKAGENSAQFRFLAAFNQLGRFAVPSFLILSGFFMVYGGGAKPDDLLKKRLLRIVPPYLVWSVVFYFFAAAVGDRDFKVRWLVKEILLGNVVYPYYFIVLIVQCYLVWWAAARAGASVGKVIWILLAACNAACVLDYYLNLTGFSRNVFWSQRVMIGWAAYFAAGLAWAAHWERVAAFARRRRALVALLAVVLFGLSMAEFNAIYARSGDFALAGMRFKLSLFLFPFAAAPAISTMETCPRLLDELARYSFPIYLIHEPFLSKIAPPIIAAAGGSAWFAFPALVVIALAAPYAFVRLFYRLAPGRYLRYVFGA